MLPGRNVEIRWNSQPLVRFLLPFALGCFCSQLVSAQLMLMICWLFLLLLWLKFRFKTAGLWRIFSAFLLSLLVGLTGMLTNTNQKKKTTGKDLVYGLLEVLPEPVYKKNSFRFDAVHIATFENSAWKRAAINYRVILRADSTMEIKTGTVLLCIIKPEEPPVAIIQGAFSMKKWLADKGIEQLLRLDSGEYLVTTKKSNQLQRELIDFRKQLISRLSEAGMAQRELTVAGALLLGDRAEIDQELVKDFTASGLVHILAVSGMHVGLIYGAWMLLLGLIIPQRKKSIIAISAIPLIWTYALITGLSPSVLRAVVMYTLLTIASLRKSPAHPLNALAAAALLMVISQPGVYKNLGFQLSFAAVWGIIVMQPLIRSCEMIRYRWLRMIAVSAMVTLAAQAATAPLGFYHFGSFPVYFFLANILAIPLSTILTYWGIATVLLAPVKVVGQFFVIIFEKGIQLLNSLAHTIQLLPHSRIAGYFISNWELIISLLLLFQFSLLISNPGLRRLKIALYHLLFLSLFSTLLELKQNSGFHYLASAHKKQLDILVFNNGCITRIQAGGFSPKSLNQEMETILGKEFRRKQPDKSYQFNRQDLISSNSLAVKTAIWRRLKHPACQP